MGAKLNVKTSAGGTPLLLAAENRAWSMVELLLDFQPDLTAISEHTQEHILHRAASEGKDAIITTILKRGVNADVLNKFFETPLMMAARYGHLHAVEALVLANANINLQNQDEVQALHEAAAGGHLEVLKYLLLKGADIHAETKSYTSVLSIAAQNCREEIVVELLARGISLGRRRQRGLTILAVKSGIVPLLEAVLNQSVYMEPRIPLLLRAVIAGHQKITKMLLEAGTHVNITDIKGENAAHKAARSNQKNRIQILHEHGVNFEARNKSGETPLVVATKKGSALVVKMLLNVGVDVCLEDRILPIAMQLGHKDIVQLLLQDMFNPNEAEDEYGLNYVYFASMYGWPDVLSILLQKGGKVNAAHNRSGLTPLHVAAWNQNTECIRLLMKYQADPYAQTRLVFCQHRQDEGRKLCERFARVDYHQCRCCQCGGSNCRDGGCSVDCGTSPLLIAASKGNLEIVELLLGKRENYKFTSTCYIKDESGRTPLYCAARSGSLQIVSLLVQLMSRNRFGSIQRLRNGYQPMHGAAEGGHAEIIEFLIQEGCDINVEDNYKATPLRIAFQNKHWRVVVKLLTLGASSLKVFGASQPSTLLHESIRSNLYETSEELILVGVEIDLRDHNGDTPLILATKQGNTGIVRLLIKHGANISITDSSGDPPITIASRAGDVDIVTELMKDRFKQGKL